MMKKVAKDVNGEVSMLIEKPRLENGFPTIHVFLQTVSKFQL